MKTPTLLLTACLCAFAVSVASARPDNQPNPNNKKSAPKKQTVASKPQSGPKQKSATPKKERTVSDTQSKNVKNAQSKKVDKSNANELRNSQVNKVDKVNKVNANSATLNNVQKNNVRVNQEQVRSIQAQHVNFRAVPNTAITSVRYNQNYRIANANNWVGPRYEVFRNYQPEWHDRGWYAGRYATVSLIAGGWYYFNNNYWYPAWGYNEAESYYPYDGPIYSGPKARPADQVVADVQGVLKEEGFYKGEVDGLLGPMTREAVTAYQEAQGLSPTAAIDEPTLESLGLS
jgi:hypothetical protein